MEQLLTSTTAYRTIVSDCQNGRPSHAYLIEFGDEDNLRQLLKLCAMVIYRTDKSSRVGELLQSEHFVDCKIYPAVGKKYVASEVTDLLDETFLRPTESDCKLFVLDGFQDASPIIQNKLLKTLEEPPEGVIFLLGATTLSPLLDTVLSRVKKLVVPPFADEQIEQMLVRTYGKKEGLREAVTAASGIPGKAVAMLTGDRYQTIWQGAVDFCTANTLQKVATVSAQLGESPYKSQLLERIQQLYFQALTVKTGRQGSPEAQKVASLWSTSTLLQAESMVERAFAEIKFNAWFQGLLYHLGVAVIQKEQSHD